MALDLSSIKVSIMEQVSQGTAVTGAGATVLNLLPGQGIQQQIQQVVSELLDTTRNSERPRQGTRFYNFAGETEVGVDTLGPCLPAVVGGTPAAAIVQTEATLTSCTITGTGVTITFAAGNTITAGVRVGMFATFTNLSVGANNSVTFPIADISANGRVWTIPSGYLADNAADTAFTVTVHPHVYSDDPYDKRYHTLGIDLPGLTGGPRTLRGTDFVFNALGIDVQPNRKAKLSLGLGGRVLELQATGSYPNFTSPTLTEAESLYLVDGGLYFDGVKRVDIASLSMRYEAPVSGLALATAHESPDTYLGQFKMTGQFTGTVADGADFDAFDAEDRVTLILHLKEQSTQAFVGIAITNAAFGGWNIPAGGEGPAIQTVPINAGKDKRGAAAGYAPTSILISQSTAF